MIADTECPYCGAALYIDHEDGYGYAEHAMHHQECRECKKSFTYTTTIFMRYRTCKADCLNDGEHQMEMTNTYHPDARLRCRTCGYEKPLTPNPGEEL